MGNLLYRKHILSVNDFNLEDLELVLYIADRLKTHLQQELLKNKVIASFFFEASTMIPFIIRNRDARHASAH
jgi:aspartate carbamoyltransferase catalytic subunit